MPLPSSPSELVFASFLDYSPRGRNELSQGSKAFALKLKANRIVVPEKRITAAAHLVDRLLQELPGSPLEGFFHPDDILVPVPTSSVSKPGTVWPGMEIANALRAGGIGSQVLPMLSRARAMRKSAFAAPGHRPTLEEHLESLSVHGVSAPGSRLVLVDDFVTKGTTLLASAQALRASTTDLEIVAFAAFRTLGLQPEIDRIVHPVVGRIWLEGDEVEREP